MLSNDDWAEARRDFVKAWAHRDLETAFALIDKVMMEGTPEMTAQALIYRALMKSDRGDVAGAKQDYLEAAASTPEGSSARYFAEQGAAGCAENLGLIEEALELYRAALGTCSRGGQFHGLRAMTGFLSLHHGDELSPGDRRLVISVAKKSWSILHLPGILDEKDLTSSAALLENAFRNHNHEEDWFPR